MGRVVERIEVEDPGTGEVLLREVDNGPEYLTVAFMVFEEDIYIDRSTYSLKKIIRFITFVRMVPDEKREIISLKPAFTIRFNSQTPLFSAHLIKNY